MPETKKRSVDLRKQHNCDLIRRMRNGEPLNSIDSKASWYPPRPVIKKDAIEVARVYGGAPFPEKGPTVAKAAPASKPTGGSAKVVDLGDVAGSPRLAPIDEAS